MKLETFFEKFDQFADAPDAVARMRELVLNFAVAGRLSEHRAGDVPVSELIDTLSAAQVRRGKTGRRGATAAVAPESVIDRPIDVPSHWAWVPISEIGAMSGGMTPSKDKSTFWDGDVNWFSSKDIKTDELTESELKITRKATQATGLQVYSPGCLVIVARSGILKRTLPVSILRVEGTVNQDLKVLSPFVGGMERYLQIMLRGMTGFILTELVKTGMTVQSLKYEEFEAQPFPLPPLAEQKRIVAKVDELMALCDQLEAQQQERETRHAALARASLSRFADAPTPANLHFLFHPSYTIPPADLRKSILTLAVQGKLVPQDPNDEPAEEIVSRIETERPEETEAPVDEAELPWSLPSCWQWVRLGTIANIKHGYAFSSESFTSEPTRYVLTTPGSFYESGGFRDRGANTKYFKGEVPPAFVLKARDLIIPMTEQAAGLLGSPAFIPDDGKTYLHNQRLGKMEFYSDEVSPEFVFCFFNSEFFRGELARTCTGMKVRHTSPKRVLKVPFPLPPLAEQRRIVAKVEQLMALVDALETQLAASRATTANLLSALVAELTEGTHASPAC
jgi:type I restriction enzyme, S subunit